MLLSDENVKDRKRRARQLHKTEFAPELIQKLAMQKAVILAVFEENIEQFYQVLNGTDESAKLSLVELLVWPDISLLPIISSEITENQPVLPLKALKSPVV